MVISPDTRLGRYEIRSQLGAGCMGEVQLARDPKINRDVAIKSPPAAFSSDSRTTASLRAGGAGGPERSTTRTSSQSMLIEPRDGSEVRTDLPTRKRNTDPGTVVGTVGYMSPEQVRGQRVDHRSNLFSLGVILYDMLSGKRAFRGESAIETLNAILKEEPPNLSESNSHKLST